MTDEIEALYRAFNARDMDALLASMHPDVDWPNGWEGGRLSGIEAVRDYWTRQWAEVDPTVTPEEIVDFGDGHVVVRVDQVVKDKAGELLTHGPVLHDYRFEDGRVRRMDIEAVEQGA